MNAPFMAHAPAMNGASHQVVYRWRMGLLSDFFVASRSAAADVLAGNTAKLKKLETKSIDGVKLASLEKITAKALGAKAVAGDTELLTDEENEEWVFLVSPSLKSSSA